MDIAKMMTQTSVYKSVIEAIETEVIENNIKISIGGDLKVKKVTLNNVESPDLKNAINAAIRKAQELQVIKMKELVDLDNTSTN